MSALALSKLNATHIAVRFADGSLVDTHLADTLPPVCELTDVTDRDSVEVVLALPLINANGGNLENGADSERPRRWVATRERVQELSIRTASAPDGLSSPARTTAQRETSDIVGKITELASWYGAVGKYG